jgi:hypothetical protein
VSDSDGNTTTPGKVAWIQAWGYGPWIVVGLDGSDLLGLADGGLYQARDYLRPFGCATGSALTAAPLGLWVFWDDFGVGAWLLPLDGGVAQLAVQVWRPRAGVLDVPQSCGAAE